MTVAIKRTILWFPKEPFGGWIIMNHFSYREHKHHINPPLYEMIFVVEIISQLIVTTTQMVLY